MVESEHLRLTFSVSVNVKRRYQFIAKVTKTLKERDSLFITFGGVLSKLITKLLNFIFQNHHIVTIAPSSSNDFFASSSSLELENRQPLLKSIVKFQKHHTFISVNVFWCILNQAVNWFRQILHAVIGFSVHG